MIRCPLCGGELEDVWMCADTVGNECCDWCPECELSVCYVHLYAHHADLADDQIVYLEVYD